MDYLSIDTEYSSFYSIDRAKSGELLQLSIVPVIDGVKDMDRAFNEYCKPLTKVWNNHAEKVHKITRKRAETFQHPSELVHKLGLWIDQFDNYFTPMGFNCTGDKRYIERALMDYRISNSWHYKVHYKWLDILDMAKSRKKMIPKKSLTLSSLCEYFGISIDAHNALSDASVTVDVRDRLKLIKSPTEGRQAYLDSKLTEVEKRRKYLDMKYVMFNGEGSVYLTEHATEDKEALRIILGEIWNVFAENREN